MKAIFLCGFAKLRRKKIQNLLLCTCIIIMAATLLNAFILLGKLGKVFEQSYESMQGPHMCALWSDSTFSPELVQQYLEASPEKPEYLMTSKTKSLEYIVSGENRLSNGVLLELPKEISTDLISPRILDDLPITMPDGNEIWITTKLANILNLKVGDELILESSATSLPMQVVKIVADPVFGSANTPIYRIWCGYNQLETFPLPQGRTLSYLEIRFQEYSPSAERKFIQDAEEAFDMPLSDTIYTYDRIKAGYTSTYEMIGGISSLVSAILAVMIVVMTLFLVQSDMSEDIRKIGIYKSIGMTNGQVIASYLVGYGVLVLVGGVLGSILGEAFSKNILTSILGDLGIFKVAITGVLQYQIAVCILIFVTIMITSFCVIVKIHKLNTSHAIRRGTWTAENRRDKKRRKREGKEYSFIERVSFEFYYALKGMWNKKARYVFIATVSLVLGCLTILCIGSLKAINNIDEEPEIWGFIRSDIYITSLEDAPVSGILEELKEDQRVDYAYGVNRIYPQYKPQGQQGYQSIAASLYEIPWNPKVNHKFLEGRAPQKEDEIALGLGLVETYGLGVGDTMELFVNGKNRNYQIVGTFQTLANYGNIIEMVTENLDEFLEQGYGDYMLVLHDGSAKWGYSEELNQKYNGSINFIASKSNGENLAGALVPALGTLITILLLITVLITINLTFILIKREQNLIGKLKAVGMTSWQILQIYLWRNCLSAAFGNILGILLGTFLMPVLLNPYAKVLGLAEFPFSSSVMGGIFVFFLLPVCMFVGTSTILKGINRVSVKRLVEDL